MHLLQRFAVAGLAAMALTMPINAQVRMRGAADIMAVSDPAGRRTTISLATVRDSFDIVPCAEDERDHPIPDCKSSIEATKQAFALIAWIVVQTNWAVRETPPIRLIPPAELLKMFPGETPADFHVEALYSEKDHVIYLSDTWRPDNLRDRSVLLHELVHHLQYLNHVKVTCESEYDFQAFNLQVAWLSEQGVGTRSIC